MARRRQKQTKQAVFWLAILLLAAVWIWYFGQDSEKKTVEPVSSDGKAQVYFLDVGQGDSELIRIPGGPTVLIDAGTKETEKELTAYLKKLGVTRIDAVIATHPHEDHIGGMEKVIRSFEIGKVYLPKVADDQTPTTRTYENMLKAVSDKGLKITAAKGGMTALDQNGAKLEFLAPNSSRYEGLNSYSVVAKLTYGGNSFLFTGDAETDSEEEMIKKGYDLHSDVLKCGHHGSSSSTGAAFLNKVSPGTAVISCGVDNSYGHPHKEVLKRLEKAGVKIYRTDTMGTILAESDGSKITMTSGLASVIPK